MSPIRACVAACMIGVGGPLLAQQPPAGAPPRAVVRGTVYDSVAQAPLAGAMVQLVPDESGDALLSAVSDSLGRWEIAGVEAGRYLAGFFHESADALGVRQRVLHLAVVAGDTMELALATPSGEAVRAALCRPPEKADSTGLVLGVVRDADSGIPLVGSTVVLGWPELVFSGTRVRTEVRQVTARSDEDGWFAICGVPHDGDIILRAELGADSSGFVAVTVPPKGTARQTLRVGRGNTAVTVAEDSTGRGATILVRRGSARLTGRVVRGDGGPLEGAQLTLWGSDAAAITGSDGSFSMAALPVGTYTLETRVLGFEPMRTSVQLARDSTTTVEVRVERRIPVLETVTVFGKRRQSPLTRALERRELGVGRFFTRAEIERQGILETTDLLRRVAGVRVVPSGTIGYAVLMRGNCVPMLWVDGVKYPRIEDQRSVMPRPQEIAILEVYNGPESPAEFTPRGCGAIVIWTGR